MEGDFTGGVRYSACCVTTDQKLLVLAGGTTPQGQPLAESYAMDLTTFSLDEPLSFQRTQDLIQHI